MPIRLFSPSAPQLKEYQYAIPTSWTPLEELRRVVPDILGSPRITTDRLEYHIKTTLVVDLERERQLDVLRFPRRMIL